MATYKIQLRATSGKKKEEIEIAKLFKGLPKLGTGVALVERDTKIVLTFLAETKKGVDSVKRAAGVFKKLGLEIDTKVTELD
jgi:hypothetical protein